MKTPFEISQIARGQVDQKKEHFALYHFDADGIWEGQIPVALVGLPEEGVVNVLYLIDTGSALNSGVIGDIDRSVRFYLIDLKEANPWGYAQYHCNTSSNIYDNVHWSFVDPERRLIVQEDNLPS